MSLKADGPLLCEECGQEEAGANVEAFETTGRFLCEECAEAALEAAGDA